MYLVWALMSDFTSWHRGTEPKNCFHEKGNPIAGGFFVLFLNATLVLVSVVANFPGENVAVLHICVVFK